MIIEAEVQAIADAIFIQEKKHLVYDRRFNAYFMDGPEEVAVVLFFPATHLEGYSKLVIVGVPDHSDVILGYHFEDGHKQEKQALAAARLIIARWLVGEKEMC